VASYVNGARRPTQFHELTATVALAWRADEAAHPRLAPGGDTARWEGYLQVLRPGAYRFSVQLRGKFRLKLGPTVAIAAEVAGPSAELRTGPEMRLESGLYRFRAEFERLPGVARAELFWEGPQFRWEPLPYDQLGHLPDQESAELAEDRLAERGRFLVEEHACHRCHRPADENGSARTLEAREGPDLSEVGRRVYVGWIYRWLEAPQRLRPDAVMPQLFADDAEGAVERQAVARYLASLGGPFRSSPQPADKAARRAQIERGGRLFTGIGCAACHEERKRAAGSLFPLTPPPVPLGNLRNKTTPEQLAAYLKDPLAVDGSGRMPHLLLQPDEARDLAQYLCREDGKETALPAPPTRESVRAAFQRVEARAEERSRFDGLSVAAQIQELGQRLVLEKGCNNCHSIAPGGKPFASVLARTTFEEIQQPHRLTAGCLADKPTGRGRSPRFAFGAAERQALRQYLRRGAEGAGSPAPAHAAWVALQRFGCLACHGRDGEGGLRPELVEGLRRVERADNSEAVIPPPLTGVAHKLRTPWMGQVLVHAGRARPWMSLRMPQFGAARVGRLPEALAALEGTEPQEATDATAVTPAKVAAGRQLVGSGAFGCISCHDLAGIANAGTRGPDLASMNERVRYGWYRRWLEQAQRMQSGTRMPTVFAEGKSLVTSLFKGDADAQADALWAYLSLGRNLPLPDGIQTSKGIPLVVTDLPVLLRTFLPDVGPRALAVGYPGGVSVAFDAAACRLAYAWTGPFLDASPVWTERGGNPANVLGRRIWTAPAGCPWALTASAEVPDFAARALDPSLGAALPEGQAYAGPRRLQYEGYTINPDGQPAFHYRIGEGRDVLEVGERPEPLFGPGVAGLARHFVLRRPEGTTAWFCAGQATRPPQVLEAGHVPADSKPVSEEVPASDRMLVLPQEGTRILALRAVVSPAGGTWRMRKRKDSWEVLLRLPASGEAISVRIHVWPFEQADGKLLQELAGRK
jgi:mono/diheme cytochrome c family protein